MNYCKLIKKQEKIKKNGGDCVGLNLEWFLKYLIIPTSVLFTSVVSGNLLYDFVQVKYDNYLINQSLIKESESIEQSIEASIQYEKESIRQSITEQSEKRRIEQEEKVRLRKEEQEYEDKVIKNKVLKGTMVRDKNTRLVGRVNNYQGERIFTNTEFYFDLDENLNYPSHIEEIGLNDYLERLNTIQKSRDKELKQLATKLLDEEKIEDTKYTQSLFTIKNYGNNHYFKYGGNYYKVKKIDGSDIKTKEGPVFNSKVNQIEEIGYIEYEKHRTRKEQLCER